MNVTEMSRSQLEDEVTRLRDLIAERGDGGDGDSSESQLLKAETRYRALFEAIDDGFCIIGFIDGPEGMLSDYVHLEANAGYGRHTGITDIIGKRLREIEPDNADVWLELYGGVLETGTPIRFEQFFQAVGRHIEVSATRVEPRCLRQVAVLFRDVTARKQTEGALKESEARARDSIERVNLAMKAGAILGTWLWDLGSDLLTVDESFALAFGLDSSKARAPLRMQQVIERIHPDDRDQLKAAMRETFSGGGAYIFQHRVKSADGHYHWVEANGRVEKAADGSPLRLLGVLIDIESRRAVEAERDRALAELRLLNDTLEQRVEERTAALIEAEEALRQAHKMEAVGQLTGGLAHDFNNILAGIGGSLDIIRTKLAQGHVTELERYVNGANQAVRRAASLTQRLLAFSRRQTLDPKPSNINKIIADMHDLISRSVGPGVAVETVAAGGLWLALVDAGQLENALLNLCINARDAMPDGGRLTIETGNRWLDARAAAERGLDPGQYVSLCVSDTGTGMPADIVERAFDPFFTTKPIGQGTGLGLSMVYGFAGQSGGAVRIYSEVGHGTMVCIYLPRHVTDEVFEALPVEAATAPPAQTGKTILVVDDEPLVRMVTVEMLEDVGYSVMEAEDGPRALKILEAHPEIDLLVTDVGLPKGMNGRQLANIARDQRPGLNVLFITGYAENAVLNHGHLEHGMQIVTKPFSPENLTRKVGEIMSET